MHTRSKCTRLHTRARGTHTHYEGLQPLLLPLCFSEPEEDDVWAILYTNNYTLYDIFCTELFKKENGFRDNKSDGKLAPLSYFCPHDVCVCL